MAYRVCFVCTGNICRSPMAEHVFRRRVEEAGLGALVEIDSAGTGGWHEGDGADPRTVAVLDENGYTSAHTARRFRSSWFPALDLVIALDEGHLRELRELARTPDEAARIRLLRPGRRARTRRPRPLLRGPRGVRGVPGDGGGRERGTARGRTHGTGGTDTVTDQEIGDGTRAVRAGLPEPVKYEPTLPGPVFAAHFHLPGEPTGPYTYGRDENPTWTHLERAIGELEAPGEEGVETLVFASGMAAVSAVLFSQLKAGDAVVVPSDGYQALPLVHEQLRAYGIEVRTAPTGGDAQLSVLDGARLLWIETPSNPGLDVCDIRRLVDEAHAAGALVAVDNTLATPLGQRPLALGADFSVASDTKGMTGHGDILLGHVSCRDPLRAAEVRRWRKIVGAIPGPMEAWLAHRSLATLQLRIDRQCSTALALARALAERADVTGLRYPGLPDDPSHAVAARQMRRFGPVVSFELADRKRADRFLEELRLVDDATSFGGVRSTAERRGRWGGDAVAEGFIRFSVGAEDPEDLIADVLRALDEAGVAG